jgi:hypothetical protein
MSLSMNIGKMPQNFCEEKRTLHVPSYTTILNRPKSSSGKVLIPYLIRMVIKFSCAVPDIDQKILPLSIPNMWNLARKGRGFGLESILIIISCGFMHIEKRGGGLQVVYTSRYHMSQKGDEGQIAIL